MSASSAERLRATVILLHSAKRHVSEEEQIEALAEAFGLLCQRVDIETYGPSTDLTTVLKRSSVLAVFAAQDVLKYLDNEEVLAGLQRPGGKPIPILFFSVGARDGSEELKKWSRGVIQGVETTEGEMPPTLFEVARVPDVTGALSGWALPAVTAPVSRILFESGRTAQAVVEARGEGTGTAVLVRVRSDVGDLFFAPEMKTFDRSWIAEPSSTPKAFSSMAAFVFFLFYAARDYSWHLEGCYANLTIDDPWLTQPYGNLDFAHLAKEMEQHNFHTSIAFVPWNSRRSKRDVINLFRNHSEHFSVCIHGNNHTHREFGDYAKNPFPQQVANIEQGVARMEQFRALTGISYDRFMVFPHGIAPERTLSALKQFNFLGTANSVHVPLGEAFPNNATFLLRTYTIRYAQFLSLIRYPAEQPPGIEIAVNVFLGNPLLFYSHQDLFEEGIDTFNKVADFVNHIQGSTRWASLGEIARHLYEVRRRIDDGFDVRMLCKEINLENSTGEEQTYYVEHADTSQDVQCVTVDDAAVSFHRSRGVISFRVSISTRQTKVLRVAYRDDLDIPKQDIRKRRVYASSVRLISDFRDLQLAKSPWGRRITRKYYLHRLNHIESTLASVCGSVQDYISSIAIRLWGGR